MATSIIIPRLCLWARQTTIFSTYSCERLNFPALAKIRSYSVTFVRERLQLLRWFFTWTTHLFSRKKLSLPREEPQVIFAIPAKEHFVGACAILVVCQQRKVRFRWLVGYGPLWRMTEISSVIENCYPSALVIISLPSPTFHCMFSWLPLLVCSSCAGGTKSKTSTLLWDVS